MRFLALRLLALSPAEIGGGGAALADPPAAPAAAPAAPPSSGNAIKDHLARIRNDLATTGAIGPLGKGSAQTAEAGLVNDGHTDSGPATQPDDAAAAAADDGLVDAVAGATQDATGKWRNPDGKFARAPGAEPPVTADVATDGAESDTAAAEPLVVKLRGRNETDPELEIEVTDPAVAERLRQNANDGMRRADYNRQMAELQRDRSELREFGILLETAPESIVDQMTPDRRERVLRYLLASDFESVKSTVEQWYSDDTARRGALVDMREQAGRSRQETAQRSAGERRADEIRAAVADLIPETAAEADAQDFYTDAIAYLSQMAQQRGDVDPRAVPELLAARMRRYWGAATAAVPQPAAPAPPAPLAVARPVGANAESVAQKAQRARASVARTQTAQATRAIAAKIAPQGAGAVPTVTEQPPKGQNLKQRLAWFASKVRPG